MQFSKEEREFKFEAKVAGERLDQFLHSHFKHLSRERLKKLIKEGKVKVNSKVAFKPGDRLQVKDKVSILIELSSQKQALLPENIPLEVIYQDQEIALINKPAGLLTHPSSIEQNHTLVNALLFQFGKLSEISGPLKPGIVHRLDKETSGIILVAKTDFAHLRLAEQFKNRTLEKKYLAVVGGRLEHDEGWIEEPIARGRLERKKMRIDYSKGKIARTQFKVLRRLHSYTFVLLYPKTGRTHQLRVHMKYLGHPILGDAKYGKKSALIKRQALHAYYLRFFHPRTQEPMSFKAEIPQDFKDLLLRIGIDDYLQILENTKLEV